MYERFTDRARKVMNLANQEAQRFNHEYIGTEHILLGLILDGAGIAANVLKNLDIDLRRVRHEVEKVVQVGPGPEMDTEGMLPQTPRAKQVIEYAIDEAKKLGHNYVGTEHLLLGLLREQDGVAGQVLRNLGLLAEYAREETLSLLGTGVTDNTPSIETDSFSGPSNDRNIPKQERKKKSKTPALDSFGRDLNDLVRNGCVDVLAGYQNEIGQVVQILCRYRNANPILVGQPGVNRTAVLEGLAADMANESVPSQLRNYRLISLDMCRIIAGAIYRGQLEERLLAVFNEARRAGNVIIDIGELQRFLGLSDVGKNFDSSFVLRESLRRSELRCISEATPEEYRICIEAAPEVAKEFKPVSIENRTSVQTLDVLNSMLARMSTHFGFTIHEDALKTILLLCDLCFPDRPLPDRAIDLLDDVVSRIAFEQLRETPPTELAEMEKEINRVVTEKELAVAEQDFEVAALHRSKADELCKKRDQLVAAHSIKVDLPRVIDRNAVIQAIAMILNLSTDDLSDRLVANRSLVASDVTEKARAAHLPS